MARTRGIWEGRLNVDRLYSVLSAECRALHDLHGVISLRLSFIADRPSRHHGHRFSIRYLAHRALSLLYASLNDQWNFADYFVPFQPARYTIHLISGLIGTCIKFWVGLFVWIKRHRLVVGLRSGDLNAGQERAYYFAPPNAGSSTRHNTQWQFWKTSTLLSGLILGLDES